MDTSFGTLPVLITRLYTVGMRVRNFDDGCYQMPALMRQNIPPSMATS